MIDKKHKRYQTDKSLDETGCPMQHPIIGDGNIQLNCTKLKTFAKMEIRVYDFFLPQDHATKIGQHHGISKSIVQQFSQWEVSGMENNGTNPAIYTDLFFIREYHANIRKEEKRCWMMTFRSCFCQEFLAACVL